MKHLKEEIVDNDEITNIVKEIELLIKEDRYNNDSIKDFKKKIFQIKLEEALINYMGENDLRILKTEFPDNNCKYLTKKSAYPYEYFNSFDDLQNPVDNLKEGDFFSKLKNNVLMMKK